MAHQHARQYSKKVGNDTRPRSVRLTSAEYDIIGRAAQTHSLPVATYMRNALLEAANTTLALPDLQTLTMTNLARSSNAHGYEGTVTIDGRVRTDVWGGIILEEEDDVTGAVFGPKAEEPQ